ncbi:MAG: hypothetical protein V4671_27240 [Armatimonadota bacterium]
MKTEFPLSRFRLPRNVIVSIGACFCAFSALIPSAMGSQIGGVQQNGTTPDPVRPVRSGRPGIASPASVLLLHALREAYRTSGATVLADSTVSYERVPASLLADKLAAETGTSVPSVDWTAEKIEKGLTALVKVLPPGTIWGKLYLPAPVQGRIWKGDDVAAFAFAQVSLFGDVGKPASDGSIELLGKRISKEAAPAYIAGLGLKPVYLITNTKRRLSVSSWSAASEEQWSGMSKEERKQYGEQQAAQIMALSPEERARVLDQIRQHDKFFDTVKDPLEKMLGPGHGL